MTSSGMQQSKDVLEAEVPPEIMEQFRLLENALKENDKLARDFLTNSSTDDLQKLDNDLVKLARILKEMRTSVRKERMKNHVLSEQVARDGQMAEQVHRRHELLTKNPQYGRAQSIEYMHSVAGEHEQNLMDFDATIARVEQMLQSLIASDRDGASLTEADFFAHIHRFDQIFEVVASQVCEFSEEVDKLKDAFLDHQRKIYGRYATNPFDKRRERQKMSDAFSNLKGLDAFPSQHAVLSMSEFLPRQQAVQAPTMGTGSTFGSAGGIFGGAKPATAPTFGIFGQPATSAAQPFGLTSQAPSLFGTTATSTAAAPLAASKPLFGTPLGTSTAPTLQPAGGFTGFGAPTSSTAPAAPSALPASSTFGSTMSSASSGTLFRGSAPASTIGAPPTKSLFGNK